MNRRMMAGQLRFPGSGILIPITLLFLVWGLLDKATAQTTQHQTQRFKVTILSTMLVGDTTGIGEWVSLPWSMGIAVVCSWIPALTRRP